MSEYLGRIQYLTGMYTIPDRQAEANSVDPDQMSQNMISEQGLL